MQSDRSLRTLARKIVFDPDYLEAFENKLFISGPQTARRLTNFFVLLLASVIATYGLISDSTASVIGAMIVAPLMGPIMAPAAAVVMGIGIRMKEVVNRRGTIYRAPTSEYREATRSE
jgi:hypothetical protein